MSVVDQKISSFQEQGASKVHLLLDFDRAITTSLDGEDDCTTWQVLYRHLPEAGQAKYKAFYNAYRPLEAAGTITSEQARAWPSAVLDLFVEYDVNLTLVEQDFFNVVTLRPEVNRVFNFCDENGIPIIVLSAGIKNVIDLLLEKFGIKSALTIATELLVDSEGVITDWKKDTLVHTFNKRESGHEELRRLREQRPYCVLVGDSLHDADMVDGEDSVLRIRIFDPRSDEKKSFQEVQAETFSKFDMMSMSKSFHPITELLERMVNA